MPWNHALPGQSFTELLARPWLPMPELFAMRPGPSGYPPMFYAQSWIVMHYLLNQNKLSDAGAYFGLVQIRKVPVEQAIQQAFGMSAAQFEQAVKDYFHSLPPSTPAQSKPGAPTLRRPAPSATRTARCRRKCQRRSRSRGTSAGRGNGGTSARTSRSRLRRILKTSSPIPRGTTWSRTAPWPGSAWKERNSIRPTRNWQGRGSSTASDTWTHYYLALSKFRAAQSSAETD